MRRLLLALEAGTGLPVGLAEPGRGIGIRDGWCPVRNGVVAGALERAGWLRLGLAPRDGEVGD